MFAQIIQAKAKDTAALRALAESRAAELGAGEGWLGLTGGVTDDGQLFLVARFESEEAARRNSDSPEQSAWWEQFSQNLEGDATFTDSNDVVLFGGGGSDDAGFVQVMQYRTNDADALKQFGKDTEDTMGQMRPDVIGGVTVYDGNNVTDVIYFTSEAEARENEAKEPDPETQAMMASLQNLMPEEPRYLDLRDPWLLSP